MENNFIGIGTNLDGPDIPVGLGMQLAQDPKAMETFGRMSNVQKVGLIEYVQSAITGEDAKIRIEDAVMKLRDGQVLF